MALYTVSGSTIEIGGVMNDKATDFVESDFDGQSWIKIDGWQNAGTISDTAEEIQTALINRGRDVFQKGNAQGAPMQNVFAVIPGDQGQMVVRSAAAPSDKNSYAFRIKWQGGDTHLFIAPVMSAEEAGGGANTVRMLNVNLRINCNPVYVPAP